MESPWLEGGWNGGDENVLDLSDGGESNNFDTSYWAPIYLKNCYYSALIPHEYAILSPS